MSLKRPVPESQSVISYPANTSNKVPWRSVDDHRVLTPEEILSTTLSPLAPESSTKPEPSVINSDENKTTSFHLDITVGPLIIRALIDSGANRSFAGPAATNLLESSGLEQQAIPPRRVVTASGQIETVLYSIELVLIVAGKATKTEALILPTLSEDFILGMDFLQAAGMVIDFGDRSWYYRDNPEVKHLFVPAVNVTKIIHCNGLRSLDTEQEKRLAELLDRELPEAPLPNSPFPVTPLIMHHIDVAGHPPIRQKPHRANPAMCEIMKAEVDKMLVSGIIEPSHSEWASPVVLVLKGNGKYRFCVDYRRVNDVTKKDAYPIPDMVAILDQLSRAHYITTIDLSQAFFQIALTPSSREVTAFIVPGYGLYQFLRMPFGLSNSPATMQRLADRLLGHRYYPTVFVYLDDIIIVTETFDEHLSYLSKVLKDLKDANLTINREKSHFCCSEVQYLGFLVNQNGLQVDPEKTAAVVDYPAPTNLKQLRRFLGMASWYRRFIPDFATLAEPLTRLTKKSNPWIWGEQQVNSFRELKIRLTTAPALSCPDFTAPFFLQTDASSVGLGAVLTQTINDEEKVIAYASRTMTETETRYTVTEQECLAVIWSIRKFRCYLEGYSFTVITDHSSLRWLNNLRNPTGRLARWSLELMQYNLTIIHRKGVFHHVPDALSRIPDTLNLAQDDTVTEDRWYRKKFHKVLHSPDSHPDWKIVDDRLYYHKPQSFIVTEFQDLSAWKLVLPKELREEAMLECHEPPHQGHLGIDKTYRRVAMQYYWPNLFREISNFVSRCDICQRTKSDSAKPRGFMGRRIVQEPWAVIAADIMGPLPRSRTGRAYLLVIQDQMTKYVELAPLRVATGRAIRERLEDLIVFRHGAPRILITDNGTEFVNKEIKSLAVWAGINLQTTPPYHPQADPVERVNRSLKNMLRAYLDGNHRVWDQYLPEFRFAYNTAFHNSLQTSPAFANSGREPRSPTSLREELEGEPDLVPIPIAKWNERMRRLNVIRQALIYAREEASDKQAEQYNSRHRQVEFVLGQPVLRRTRSLSNSAVHYAAGLEKKYEGPFVITHKFSPTRYELSDFSGKVLGQHSVSDLKPWKAPNKQPK